MFKKIKNYFKTSKQNIKIEQNNESSESVENFFENLAKVNLDIPENRIIQNFDDNKKNLVIVDDSKGIVSIIYDYLKDIKLKSEDYNILSFFNNAAPLVLYKTLKILKEEHDLKIDYAIIDIVLPGLNKNRVDGIDIAILLHKVYSCRNFIFYTGNLGLEYSEFSLKKNEKFKKYFKKDITNFILYKDSSDEDVQKALINLFNDEYNIEKLK